MAAIRDRKDPVVSEAEDHLRILETVEGIDPARQRNATYFLLRHQIETVGLFQDIEEKLEAMPDAICRKLADMPPKAVVTQTTTEFRGPFGIVVKGTPGQIATALILFMLAYQFCATNGWLPWAGAPGAVKELARETAKELVATQGPPNPSDQMREH